MHYEVKLPDVILLNGASSSGKSTLARALQMALPEPFLNYSSDLLVDGGILPQVDRITNDTHWSWNVLRPKFFQGFHRSIPALVSSGNRVVVEHVIEHESWLHELVQLLRTFSVFYVGIMCPLTEIESRERSRGDRYIGEGKSHIEDGVHTWSEYDLVVDTHDLETNENVASILAALPLFKQDDSVFQRLLNSKRAEK